MLTKSPLEVLACDFVGPLPVSSGYKYLLVIIDCFSRYPFVFPLSDMCVSSVIKCFRQVFYLVGFPDAILSDQGSQFESAEFRNFLSGFNIRKLRTNAYHPSGNGICERFNGVFKKCMLSYVTAKGIGMHEWCKSLSHCLFDYRTTPHSSTGHRPTDLFFRFNVKGYLPSKVVDINDAIKKDFHAKTNGN